MEPGGFDPQLTAGRVAGAHVTFEDSGGVVLEGPARVARLVGHSAGGFVDPWCFQRAGEIGDLLDGVPSSGGHQMLLSSVTGPKARS